MRMDAEGLDKISRNNIHAGRRSPGHPKRRWGDLISRYTDGTPILLVIISKMY